MVFMYMWMAKTMLSVKSEKSGVAAGLDAALRVPASENE